MLRRVRRQLDRTSAAGLADLLAELESYPVPEADTGEDSLTGWPDDLVVPLRLSTEYGELAALYTTTVFGSPRDVTLDEIAIETFFPADAATAATMRAAVGWITPATAPCQARDPVKRVPPRRRTTVSDPSVSGPR